MMISSGQVEFSAQLIDRWNEDEGGFAAALWFNQSAAGACKIRVSTLGNQSSQNCMRSRR
jgi:hypothetical protein